MHVLSVNSVLLILIVALAGGCSPENPTVIIQTNRGEIVIEIYSKEAPLTANNFITNCTNEVYRNSLFYRVVNQDNQENDSVKIDVIQGGLFEDSLIKNFPLIPHESTRFTRLKHLNGTVSMARLEPGTASTEFFICIGDQPELDFGGKRNPDGQGFAAFGKVIQGMDIVEQIHSLDVPDQYLEKPVSITNIIVFSNLD